MSKVPKHLRWNSVVLWAGPRTHLVQYPLHRGEIMNLVAVFHSDRHEEGWNVFSEPEELRQRFAGQHPDVLALLERIEPWRMWVLCGREPVKTWSRGRVGLIGDAAHPMLQYLAQGACMAIEDAVCLATRLERRNGDIAQALLDYQRHRYLRTARVQLTTRFYGDAYHAAGPTAELRDMALKARTSEQSHAGVEWLYSGVDESGGHLL
jgi:2-polyprenyl-6-methoxyphenol hydroxylase-like FAD-dependent oxidoreductase